MRWVLGIETSCDETSAAVLRVTGGAPTVGGLVILSQDVHKVFGGVVPELASRAHLRTIKPVVEHALAEADIGLAELDAVTVTAGPGLRRSGSHPRVRSGRVGTRGCSIASIPRCR